MCLYIAHLCKWTPSPAELKTNGAFSMARRPSQRGANASFGVSQTWASPAQPPGIRAAWVSHWLGAVLTMRRQEPLPCGVITRIDGIADQNRQAQCQASRKKGCKKGMLFGMIHLRGATWNPPVPEGRHIAKANGEECQSPLDT